MTFFFKNEKSFSLPLLGTSEPSRFSGWRRSNSDTGYHSIVTIDDDFSLSSSEKVISDDFWFT
jgi:hypothetical protein